MDNESLTKQESAFVTALYIGFWIFWSNATILYNKWIIDTTPFKFPIILTTWHLIFATFATQLLARATTVLDGRKNINMDARTYCYKLIPIGILYSASLICSNMVYLYLSVSFAQILKASGPVATLCTSWLWGVVTPSKGMIIKILIMTLGIVLSVTGELQFSWTGFILQMVAVLFDANRVILIQLLLSDGEKMDPLVTLYYSAPSCALMNIIVSWYTEYQLLTWDIVTSTGILTLVLNAAVGFMLNISIFMLIDKTSGLVTTLVSIPKNILLVLFSVIFWGTPISLQQAVGYSIALGAILSYSIDLTKLWASLKSRIWPWDRSSDSDEKSILT